jgi:DNA-binding response OmpR family regulator
MENKKILIVEDDAVLGDIIFRKLSANNYQAKLIKDGEEGLRQVKEFKPDLVLLDIVLPKMNGYEFLEALRKDTEIANTAVIVLSNSGQPVEISRVLALGVKDYLIKADLSPDEVLSKVEHEFAATGNSSQSGTDFTDGVKILVVEDDVFLQDLLSRKLSREKCELFYANDGQVALDMIQKEKPTIILLDLLLPTMDGFEVLKKIRENPDFKTTPVMILSNLGRKEDLDKATELGATDFLIKANFSMDEIISRIKKVLKK